MSHPPPHPDGRTPGGDPSALPPEQRATAAPRSGVDPVDAEWARIERERVAEEVAEAREDAIEAIVDPVQRRGRWGWMWWAFAVALVSGVVFAGWVDLVVATNRPAPEPTPAPALKSLPSPSEVGEGAAGEGDTGPHPDEEAENGSADAEGHSGR